MSDLDDHIKEAREKLNKDPRIDQFADLVIRIFNNISKGGMRPLEAMGLTPESMEKYYNAALEQYHVGRFEDAAKTLRILMMLCPTEFRFSFALAACNHRAENWAEAISGYQAASIGNPLDPLPYYHQADCLLKLGFPEAAAESLRIAIENCTDSEEHVALKDRATVALQSITGPDASKTEKAPSKKSVKKAA